MRLCEVAMYVLMYTCSKTFDPFVELMITEVATVTVTVTIY